MAQSYCTSLGIGSAGADSTDGPDDARGETHEVNLMMRFPSRPSRLNAISQQHSCGPGFAMLVDLNIGVPGTESTSA
jgi:hypothetical protein